MYCHLIQLSPQVTYQSLGDRVREHINKLIVSPKGRLNNIILERTIEYNTTQPQNSTAKESNATFEIESTLKERPKFTLPAHVLICSTHFTSRDHS